jgi:hypothetical protein
MAFVIVTKVGWDSATRHYNKGSAFQVGNPTVSNQSVNAQD